jgi:hypothetical protein
MGIGLSADVHELMPSGQTLKGESFTAGSGLERVSYNNDCPK